MSIQIEEGKWYKTRAGEIIGPMRKYDGTGLSIDYFGREAEWTAPSGDSYAANGYWLSSSGDDDADLVAEAPAPAPVIETADGPQIAETPEWAKQVEAEAAEESVENRFRETVKATGDFDIVEVPNGMTMEQAKAISNEVMAERRADIKAVIADEAKRIVSGARRSAYGTPERNFTRIADLWTGYAKAKGWPMEFTAADVSPLMVLMKLARAVESPTHYDSMVDGVGYFLTMAEVNGVQKPDKAA